MRALLRVVCPLAVEGLCQRRVCVRRGCVCPSRVCERGLCFVVVVEGLEETLFVCVRRSFVMEEPSGGGGDDGAHLRA